MATFSIDNDRVAIGIQDVTYDQSAGVQTTPATLPSTDTGNEVDVTLSAGALDGLDADFETFLAGLTLSTAQSGSGVRAVFITMERNV